MSETALNPEDLLSFNPLDPGFRSDPYAHYARLRGNGPAVRSPVGLLVFTSHEACSTILRDPRFGHGADNEANVFNSSDADNGERVRSFLQLDPPDHARLRGLVSKAFTARRIQKLRPRVEELVAGLVSDAVARGSLDVIGDLAYPLPVTVISELLGVPPEDHERFRGWSDALARGLDPDFLLPPEQIARQRAAREEFRAYFAELAERRRAEPAGDLLSDLVRLQTEGADISSAELLATCALLLVAGHETTVNLIGNGTLALLRHPEQLAWLRAHPDEIGTAIEEILRYDPPVQLTGRMALEETEVCGQVVRAGEPVLLLLAAANRDPSVFPEPDRLDLARGTARHLAFGLGIHFCLGAPLARLEGEAALRELTRHALEPLADTPEYKDNLVLRGLAALPVRIGPATPA
ncbi:MAG TPA: cytochrome P450 [Streptosporangiaceae bacterium]